MHTNLICYHVSTKRMVSGALALHHPIIIPCWQCYAPHQMWYISILKNLQRFSPEIGFVVRSETFNDVWMYAVRQLSAAQPSWVKWNAMICLFFFNVDFGADKLTRTKWLSPYMKAGPLAWMPNMRSLYRRPRRYYAGCFIAMKSLSNVLVSTVVLFLEYQ